MFASPFVTPVGAASPFATPTRTAPDPRRTVSTISAPLRLSTDALDKLNAQAQAQAQMTPAPSSEGTPAPPAPPGTCPTTPKMQPTRAEINPSTKGKSWLSSLFAKRGGAEVAPWWSQPTVERRSAVKVQFRTTVQ